jgi:hypothetical protein
LVSGYFAGILGTNVAIGRPRLLYDPTGDPNGHPRFIGVGIANDQTTQPPKAWIVVAATAIGAGNIANCVYAFDPNQGSSTPFLLGTAWAGMTGDSVVLTANMYDSTNKFQYARLWALPKTRIYNIPHQICFPTPNPFQISWPQSLQNADGSLAQSVVPAKSYDGNSSVTYLVSASPGGGNTLTLWKLDTHQLLLYPGYAGWAVPTAASYSQAPPASQRGTSTPILTGDASLANAIYQPASGLWTVHTTACPWDSTLSCFSWYQLDPVSVPAKLLQENAFGFTGEHVYAPAVAVNRNGNAAFVFNASSANRYASLFGVGRDAGDAQNTLQGDTNFLIKSGLDIYTRGSPALYSSADVDPTNDNRFWGLGAYASGNAGGQDATCPDHTVNHDWRTEVGQMSFTGPSSGPPPPPPPTVGYYAIPTPAGRVVVPSMQQP